MSKKRRPKELATAGPAGVAPIVSAPSPEVPVPSYGHLDPVSLAPNMGAALIARCMDEGLI